MIPTHAQNAYRKSAAQGLEADPVKLIDLLYERALQHLKLAADGITEKSPKKRGESMGKVIGIISELNAALDMEKGGEASQFLRGLYESMLVELPKVSVTNDVEVLKRAYRYIKKLREIWAQTAMQEATACRKTREQHPAAPHSPIMKEETEGAAPSVAGLSVSA